MKVRFSHFWPGFNPENSLFGDILKLISPNLEIVINPNKHVDLEITSVFYHKNKLDQLGRRLTYEISDSYKWDYLSRFGRGFSINKNFKAKKTIWYTGENIRPPIGKFDGTVSFDPTDQAVNNFYFPFWMMCINWKSGNRAFEIMPTVDELTSARIFRSKSKFACSFSNTRESNREKIVSAIQSVVNCDGYGTASQRYVKSKLNVSRNYYFQICTENDLYPNYVTEKLQESWIVNSIPIWSGLDNYEWFNKKAILDVTLLSFDEIKSKVISYDYEMINYTQTQPLLIKDPTKQFHDLIDFIKNICNA